MSVSVMGFWEDIFGLKRKLNDISIYSYSEYDSKFYKILVVTQNYLSVFKGEKIVNVYQSCTRLALNPFLRGKKINVFLNHGWGTKKTPGNEEVKIRKVLRDLRRLRRYTDYVICYSDFDSTYYLRHPFLDDLPYPRFIPLGHPRNDFLVSNRVNRVLINNVRNKLNLDNDTKLILYAPTHRRVVSWESAENDDAFIRKLYGEFQELDSKCNLKKIKLIFRPHYFLRRLNWKFKNIIVASADNFSDPRPLMLASDILITDYSSIYLDYLLLSKPIVFYQPDLEQYKERRGLVVDPKNPIHMPGPKVSRLIDILDLSESEYSKFDLKKAKNFFHKYDDDKATERLGDFISKIISEKEK